MPSHYTVHDLTVHQRLIKQRPVRLGNLKDAPGAGGWGKGGMDVNNSFGARKKLGNLQRQGIIIGALGVRSRRK
jgi:hypothetical protein